MYDFGRMIEALLSNPISEFFFWFIVGYFIIALFLMVLGMVSGTTIFRTLVDNAPSILTSLGILGTFTGIFFALLDFNINTINKSVPLLLEGLKVAFGTSIMGLLGAVILRILKSILALILSRTSVSEDASAKDILETLQAIEKSNKEGLEKLRTALTDDSDSSVSGQLQRMRASVADLENSNRGGLEKLRKSIKQGFEAQINKFHEFSQHISKAFSEALIEELKAVIREFNEKISEQFGENFKQLNEAVGRLVEWQENYKQQLEQLKQAFDNAVESIQATQTALSSIENSTSAISGHMQQLSEINQVLERQLTELHNGLSSLAEMRSRAEEAVPVISEKIASMTRTISEAVDIQKNSVELVTHQLNETVNSIGNEISNSLSEQREAHNQMLNGFHETLQNATNEMNEAIVQLDDAMQTEIQRVVQVMADNLSGITERFVENYSDLLAQQRRIVKLADNARARDAR